MILCIMLVGLIIMSALILMYVPWVQTSHGMGRIVSLAPNGKVQFIHALVKGRIHKWHIRDGSIVKKGDVIAEIVDNDPLFLDRLQAQKNSFTAAKNAAGIATETALTNVHRQEQLHKQGLAARKDVENARIKYESWLAKLAEAESKVASAEVMLSRQTRQKIIAPQDGQILNTFAGDTATLVKEGDVLAEFLPVNLDIGIALDIAGMDIPLVRLGQKVRLRFDGWPAMQFSGWPTTSVGTFGGVVSIIDPAISPTGKFRVIISKPKDEYWPPEKLLRVGVRVQGWILLETVSLGYEIWRQLNGFPPEFPVNTTNN